MTEGRGTSYERREVKKDGKRRLGRDRERSRETEKGW